MRGSPRFQVAEIFNNSGINKIGESKHEAKESAREAGAGTWHEMGQNLGIHSYGTADAYRETWVRCFEDARESAGLRDISKMEPQHVQNYLNKCIDRGVSWATYSQYAAALGKLDRALNLYSENHGWDRSYDLHSGVEATRDRAQQELARFGSSRAYDRPSELVETISDPVHRLAGQIQRETGIRVNEVAQIRAEQILDGKLTVQGKGGKITHRELSWTTMDKLKDCISKNGQFKINKDTYRNSLKQASEKTAQEYQGSHGLRWNYAQDRLVELNRQGESYYSSLRKISKEMGHERPDITEHYLK